MAMRMLVQRMGPGDLTAHGFRSSFTDWPRKNRPPELADAALAHVNGDKTEAAYQRGDLLAKRRAMMEAWADYCAVAPTVAECAGAARGIAAA